MKGAIVNMVCLVQSFYLSGFSVKNSRVIIIGRGRILEREPDYSAGQNQQRVLLMAPAAYASLF